MQLNWSSVFFLSFSSLFFCPILQRFTVLCHFLSTPLPKQLTVSSPSLLVSANQSFSTTSVVSVLADEGGQKQARSNQVTQSSRLSRCLSCIRARKVVVCITRIMGTSFDVLLVIVTNFLRAIFEARFRH